MLAVAARTIELLALGFALGSTVWLPVVQSPVLVKRMGRDRFVPLQMSVELVSPGAVGVMAGVSQGAS